MTTQRRVRGVVRSGHKEDAAEVPFDPGAVWGVAPIRIRPNRRGYRVAAQIDGHRFATHVVARSRKFWLLLPPQDEALARVASENAIELTVDRA